MSNRSAFTNEEIQKAKNKYKNLKAKYNAGLSASMFGGPKAAANFNRNVLQPLEAQAKLLTNMGIQPHTVAWSGTGMR